MKNWEQLPLEPGGRMLEIENDGQQIQSTNYWDTPLAKAGAFHVSINARCFRLLVPPRHANEVLREVRGSDEVVLTRGALPTAGMMDAVEILFEDHTESPFSLHVGANQCSTLPTVADSGRTDLRCIVYSYGLKVLADLPAKFRMAQLPCLAPWMEG